jgi:hypothetical protein
MTINENRQELINLIVNKMKVNISNYLEENGFNVDILLQKENGIIRCANNMYEEYRNDNELHLIYNAENDWFIEYIDDDLWE